MVPEQRERFDYELAAPLPGHEAELPDDRIAEIEGASFMAAMMQHQALVQGG